MIHHRVPPTPPTRVLILGASGFVGTELAGYLREDRIAIETPSSGELDLAGPSAVDRLADLMRPDDTLAVIAALTPDRGRDPRTLLRNLAIATHVGEAIERSPCAHVVLISSDAVYADEVEPIHESTPPRAPSFHGLMNIARERILGYCLAKSEIPLIVLRPCPLFGALDSHNSYGPNRFMRTARSEGRIDLIGNGEERRDHLYVKDFCRVIGHAIATRAEGVVNVATGHSASFREVAENVSELLERPVEIVCSARTSPVTHRRYDPSGLRAAFPGFACTDLKVALADSLAELRQGPRA